MGGLLYGWMIETKSMMSQMRIFVRFLDSVSAIKYTLNMVVFGETLKERCNGEYVLFNTAVFLKSKQYFYGKRV